MVDENQPQNRFSFDITKLSYAAHFGIILVLIVIVAPITWVVLSGVFGTPNAASAEALEIDRMIRAHYIAISVVFAIIMVPMLYGLYAFRAKEGDYSDGDHIHGNNLLEIVWIAIPTVIVIAFGVWGTQMLFDITDENPGEMEVEVLGFQFGWQYTYNEGGATYSSAELVLPVDQPVLLKMTSRDVLHAFWVPEFRVKQDLVPGAVTEVRITPNEVGEYKIQCAEICGALHYNMLGDVRIVTQAEYDAWVAEQVAAVTQPRTSN